MKPRPSKAVAGRPSSSRRPGADLHVHTTHSDGVCSPCEVVVAAARVGLSALAITDHDTVSALSVARPEAARWGIELIGGVELTCDYEDREFHILGHFIRDDDPALLTAMAALRDGRARRFEAMAARLEALGLSIDLEAVRKASPRAALGRRHLADYLTRTRQVPDIRQVFARYLGDGGPATVAKPRLDAREAIALIRGAGGVAALAHPPHDLRQSTFQALAEAGMRAVEVDGPGFSNGKSRRLRDTADRLGLIAVAGSDFHAADRAGRWVGAITTPGDVVERLRKVAQSDPMDAAYGPESGNCARILH
jgi:3',5'-nucleoside bisphosphate phosphatase